MSKAHRHCGMGLALTIAAFGLQTVAAEDGFTELFNGRSLEGWKLIGKNGPGYVIEDGVLICPANGGGNLFTEKQYDNFVFRFDFKLSENGNNGVGIRAPLQGNAAYMGMEIQILHNKGEQYAGKLRPVQYHGSVYDVFAAKQGALNDPGEWNTEEIRADGRRITVIVNGVRILDADLNDVSDPQTLRKHPGLLRPTGHIGFLGHGSHIEFRNLRIKELPEVRHENAAPPGFTALFNGKDLTNWKGLVANPPKRAEMSPEKLAEEQEKANDRMRQHWQAEDGVLVFDGKGQSLCTVKDYKDFEFWVDWKIHEEGDSGIYLRGTPQVQIWDNPVGSGGLFNNKKNPDKPLMNADRPVGEWNRFQILMVGEKVHVFLNDQLVVNDVTMENYWERDKPIYPTGQIELQNHGNKLYFKNIFVREISTAQ